MEAILSERPLYFFNYIFALEIGALGRPVSIYGQAAPGPSESLELPSGPVKIVIE